MVGRFLCSATHAGEWRGPASLGRRFEEVDELFEEVDELCFFRFADGPHHGRMGDRGQP